MTQHSDPNMISGNILYIPQTYDHVQSVTEVICILNMTLRKVHMNFTISSITRDCC